MTNQSEYRNLNFQRRNTLLHRRATAITLGGVIFIAAWFLLPAPIMFALLLVIIIALVWMASYGWRDALFELSRFLDRLQQI